MHALNEIVSEQQQDILAIKSQVNILLEELKSVLINLDMGGVRLDGLFVTAVSAHSQIVSGKGSNSRHLCTILI